MTAFTYSKDLSSQQKSYKTSVLGLGFWRSMAFIDRWPWGFPSSNWLIDWLIGVQRPEGSLPPTLSAIHCWFFCRLSLQLCFWPLHSHHVGPEAFLFCWLPEPWLGSLSSCLREVQVTFSGWGLCDRPTQSYHLCWQFFFLQKGQFNLFQFNASGWVNYLLLLPNTGKNRCFLKELFWAKQYLFDA